MPSLSDLLDIIQPDDRAALERKIRMAFGGERVYVPPPDSRKDPARRERIAELARTLPTGVVAARVGCSQSYVRRVRARNRDRV